MFEVISGGFLGTIFGGLFRIAPEILKHLDKANERKHELAMFQLQTDLEKLRGEFRMEERYVDHSITQLDAIKSAFAEQAATAQAAGKWMSALSASVRPGITWFLFGLYAAVKVSAIIVAWQSNAVWSEVLKQSWNQDDFAMLMMILTFWFVGRSIEKYRG